VQVTNGVALFQWDGTDELDVIIGGGYELRYTPRTGVTASWDTALPAVKNIPGTATSVEITHKAGTYLLRAHDIVGIQSVGWARISSQFESDLYKPFRRTCESPTWLGVKNKTEVMEPQDWLMLSNVGGLWDDQLTPIDEWVAPAVDILPTSPNRSREGTYDFANMLDLGGVFTTRLSIDLLATSYYEGEPFMDERAGEVDTWANWDATLGIATGTVRILMRQTDDDPALPDAVWTDWHDFVVGDVTGRAFQFKAVLSAPNGQNVQIEELCVLADLRNKVDQGEDVTYEGNTLSIRFSLKFYLIPAVGITLQQSAAGDRVEITNKTREGFDLDIIAANGSKVPSMVFDWLAAGY
jgi:hypothetical protein